MKRRQSGFQKTRKTVRKVQPQRERARKKKKPIFNWERPYDEGVCWREKIDLLSDGEEKLEV